jgi:hypothetical protein
MPGNSADISILRNDKSDAAGIFPTLPHHRAMPSAKIVNLDWIQLLPVCIIRPIDFNRLLLGCNEHPKPLKDKVMV